MQAALLSSRSTNWVTPQWLFEQLDEKAHFDLDAAASKSNTKCKRFISEKQDALLRPWEATTVWLNPPYGRVLPKFARRAVHQLEQGIVRSSVWMLVPARVDTLWWQDVLWPAATDIYFVRGRLTFATPRGRILDPAPFPSAVVRLERRSPTRGPKRYYRLSQKGGEQLIE